jgi:hypothetical protein
MTVLTVTFVDQTFDRKSAEVAYLANVLGLVQASLQRSQGAVSASTSVLGVNQAGTANTSLASYTYTASASNP